MVHKLFLTKENSVGIAQGHLGDICPFIGDCVIGPTLWKIPSLRPQGYVGTLRILAALPGNSTLFFLSHWFLRVISEKRPKQLLLRCIRSFMPKFHYSVSVPDCSSNKCFHSQEGIKAATPPKPTNEFSPVPDQVRKFLLLSTKYPHILW